MSDCGCGSSQADALERKTLLLLLLINAVMFVVELVFGYVADSTGLIADSLDMLVDAGVYGLSFFAVGRGVQRQSRAATISGLLQLLLGAAVLFEVLRRFVFGSEPQSLLMMAVACVALAANLVCLLLISRHRGAGVHMRASWIFSANDVLANLGVIVCAALVYWTGSRYPDLLVGGIIALLIAHGGVRILAEAKRARQTL